MARQYYKDSTTGQMKPLGVKVEDTLPVGTEVDYDGQDIPEGWVEIDDPNTYSTEEQRIGTWIDGKPIYRKVFTGTFENDTNFHQIASNVENLINVGGTTAGRHFSYFINTTTMTGETDFVIFNGNLNYRLRAYDRLGGQDYNLFAEYTKTTD